MEAINQLWLHTPYLGMMLCGFAITTVMMLFIWMVSEKINNAGVVDVAWGYGFFIVTAVYEAIAFLRHDGWLPRRLLILLMVATWSLRLGTFLYLRFRRHYPREDGRYAEYRRAWGDKASLGMLGAFQMQAVLLATLTLPFALIILNDAPGFYPGEIIAALIWLVAFIGEATADHQAETFKKDPSNKDKVCQVGLWHYSRHPNYFFEWLTWVAFFFFALPAKGGLSCAICPVLMYYFLTRVTGVKATEEQALRTRGDAYREYQKTTSSFFPMPRKKD